jgi:zinc transporter, ZIP family
MFHQAVEWSGLIARAGIPVAAALAGGAVGAAGTGKSRIPASLIVHFAAGAFLAVALIHLLPEAAEGAGWPAALLGAAVGSGFCALLARWAGGFCPACLGGKEDSRHGAGTLSPIPSPLGTARVQVWEQGGRLRLGIPLLVVVSVHSALDGLALVGEGRAHVGDVDLISMAVLLHKLPEGMAVAAVCRSLGMSAASALVVTAFVEACTFAGLLAGLLIGSIGERALSLGVGVVAGTFLYLVVLTFSRDRDAPYPLADAGAAVAGGLLILLSRLAVGH